MESSPRCSASRAALQNRAQVLPLRAPSAARPVRLYNMGLNPRTVADPWWGGYTVTAGDFEAEKGETRPAVPAGTDYALLRVEAGNPQGAAQMFGGPLREELNLLAFSDMAHARSWKISPSLEEIQAVMREAGAGRTILAIYFRQPFVLDEQSGLRDAAGILATFGVRDAAIMDVVTGRFPPAGRLPFALASRAGAIVDQASDAPGYDPADTLFPFGFGLTYGGPAAPLRPSGQ